MKKIVLLLMISICLISCSESDDRSGRNTYTESANYILHRNAQLKINTTGNETYIDVINGTNLVFEYVYSENGRPSVSDDEITRELYFEITPESKDFNIKNNEFNTVKAYIGKFCYCVATGYYPVNSGAIIGEKTGDLEWEVSFDVKAFVPVDNMPEATIGLKGHGNFKSL